MSPSRAAPLLALLALAACSDPEPAQRRPSVVLVSIDTLRADHMGVYGYERDTTPFLDRFAAESVVFENVFTTAAWTLIAHMSMLTGLYPEQHGVIEAKDALAPEASLLTERLRQAGYQTLGFYRPGWIAPRHGFGRGFDVFRTHHPVEEAEQHLEEELPRVSPGRPVFLFLHLFDVHNDPDDKKPPSPFSAPAPYQDLFVPGARERMASETYLTLKRKLTPQEREDLVGLYDDGIRHVDAALERIFARLAKEDWFRDALVIVTSDHGESLAQRGNWGHGGPWQEGLHVPLILRLPDRARAGETVDGLASLVDVPPTVLDFVGLPADPLLPGHSLLRPLPPDRVVTGGNAPIEYTVRWPEKMVRTGGKVGGFDLDADPGEHAPRALDAEAYAALHAALGLDPRSFHAPVPTPEMSPHDSAELKALGYIGDDEEEAPRKASAPDPGETPPPAGEH